MTDVFRPWWIDPGHTLTGRCRLRDGQLVDVVPSENGTYTELTPPGSMYRGYAKVETKILTLTGEARPLDIYMWLHWDASGNVLDGMPHTFDITENVENLLHE